MPPLSISDGEEIVLKERVSIEGLKCVGVYYGSTTGPEITSIRATKTEVWKYNKYTLTLKNEDKIVKELTNNNWWDKETKTATIYYVFDSDTTVEPSEPSLEKSLTRVKKATLNQVNGTYTIDLMISGAIGKSSVVPELDIL